MNNPTVAFGARFAASQNGAGRFRDYVWPDLSNVQNNSNSTTRNAAGTNGAAVTGSGFGGGGGNRTNVRNQQPCIDLHASGVVGNGNGVSLARAATIMLATSKVGNFYPQGFSDFQCWRVYFVASLTSIPAHEVSLNITPTNSASNNCNPITANVDSFGYTFNTAGGVDFYTRVGGVQVTTAATPTQAQGYDITLAHIYEIVMVGATRFSDAFLIAYVDGVPVTLPATSRTWGTGTKLPAQASLDAANAGFFVGAGNQAGNALATDLSIYQIRVICAPTLASLY